MATFKEICQYVAEDSGVISGDGLPSSVSNQTGMLKRIVRWVNEAYGDIQAERTDWRFLRDSFTADLLSAQATYSSDQLSITRLDRWILEPVEDAVESPVWLYDPAVGLSDEQELRFEPWQRFRSMYQIGTESTKTERPTHISIMPDNRIILYPIPDKAYKLRGEYYKTPQSLANNDDIPELPAKHHDLIKWGALMKIAQYDEAVTQAQFWQREYRNRMDILVNEQTPRLRFGPALV